MVLRRDRGLVSASRTRRKTPEQRAPDASRTNRRGPERRNRANDWKLGTWNCKSLNFDGSDRILYDELRVRSLDVVALQEVCWKGKDQRKFGEYSMFWSGGDSHELGTGFIVLGEMTERVIGWCPVNDRMCRLRIRGRFFNVSIINVHSPHMGSDADDKDAFYELLEREYRKCSKHDVKIVIGDLNAQVGQEAEFRPVIGKFGAYQATKGNGLRLIDFATSKNMAIRSTYFQHNLLRKFTWRSPNDRES